MRDTHNLMEGLRVDRVSVIHTGYRATPHQAEHPQ